MLVLGIDSYLIGAQCRDFWTAGSEEKRRATYDIDFAVSIPSQETWTRLTEWLLADEDFTKDKKLPYRFYLGAQIVDLIPFGGINHQTF
ncbi:MAG TPA: hypothetical protein VKR53_10205 [Puia sp.]|nr:hypothetical protein [Puia sp.]